MLKSVTLIFKIVLPATWPNTRRSSSATGIIQYNAASASSDMSRAYSFKLKGLTAINTEDRWKIIFSYNQKANLMLS